MIDLSLMKSKSTENIRNAVKLAKENPKIAALICVAVTGYLYKTTGSNFKSPWLDGRKIDSGMNIKQLLKTDFKPELAENIKWDVIIIGSGFVVTLGVVHCYMYYTSTTPRATRCVVLKKYSNPLKRCFGSDCGKPLSSIWFESAHSRKTL